MEFGHGNRETGSRKSYFESIGTCGDFRQDTGVIDLDAVFRDAPIFAIDNDLVTVRKAGRYGHFVAVRRVLPYDLRKRSCRDDGEIRERVGFGRSSVYEFHGRRRNGDRRRNVCDRPSPTPAEWLQGDEFNFVRTHRHVIVVAFLKNTVEADGVAFVVARGSGPRDFEDAAEDREVLSQRIHPRFHVGPARAFDRSAQDQMCFSPVSSLRIRSLCARICSFLKIKNRCGEFHEASENACVLQTIIIKGDLVSRCGRGR